ncbi:unnamed protein product, partial [Polarella glacialis]
VPTTGLDDDDCAPVLRLRDEVVRRADRLGSILEAVLSHGFCNSAGRLRDLVGSCACLSAALATHCGQTDGFLDDGFTLSCRVLLSTCLDAERVGCSEAADFTATLAALAALAWNVGDLEISRSRLVQHIGLLSPQERAQARRRLS